MTVILPGLRSSISYLVVGLCISQNLFADQMPDIANYQTAQTVKSYKAVGSSTAHHPVIDKIVNKKLKRQTFKSQNFINDVIAVRHVNISGNSIFDTQQLKEYFHKLAGQTVTKQELIDAARTMIIAYWDAGYALADANITIASVAHTNGKTHDVDIKINEGYLHDIDTGSLLLGEDPRFKDFIMQIKKMRPFNISAFQYENFSIDALSDVPLRVDIKPIDGMPGAGRLILEAAQERVTPYAALSNRGSKYLGPLQTTAGIHVHSLLTRSDVTGIKTRFTPRNKELFNIQLQHITPIEATQDKVNILYDHNYIVPGSIFKTYHYRGKIDTFLVEYQHVYKTQSTQKFNSNFGFKTVDNSAKTLYGTVFNDKTREIYATLNTNFVDQLKGIIEAEIAIHQGIKGLNESKTNQKSRADARTDFTYTSFKIQRSQLIAKDVSLFLAGGGQYSWRKLLLNNRFYLGGTHFGSAYDDGEIGGDHGLGGRAELQFNTEPDMPQINAIQYYGFYDGGKIWRKGSNYFYKNASLVSAGVGLKTDFCHDYKFNIEFAKPLTKAVNIRVTEGKSRRPLRVFFKLEALW